jgi:hypothetical protein
MRLKIKGILALLAVVGMVSAGTVANVYVNKVYLENEAKFTVQLSNSSTSWYVVNESSYNSSGEDRFNQFHALCVAALNNGKLVTVNYSGTASPFTITDIKIKR